MSRWEPQAELHISFSISRRPCDMFIPCSVRALCVVARSKSKFGFFLDPFDKGKGQESGGSKIASVSP